jgi:hypothetical protein
MAVSVNGKQTYSGSVRSFSVRVGAVGTVTTVHATVTISGRSFDQTLAIEPQDVMIVAEPLSYAPPLYPGKPAVPLEGNVRLVALASLRSGAGTAGNPSTYGYVWTIDGIEQIDSSGIGRSSIIVPSPLEYRSSKVSVVVTNPGTGVTGTDELTYTALDPIVRIYENDPLLGIRFDHALPGGYAINGAEATLFAAPFWLPTTSGAPAVQWFLNGNAVQTGNSVTLRPAGSGQGSASLSLTASSGQFANTTASLGLSFGTSQSSNFLGL